MSLQGTPQAQGPSGDGAVTWPAGGSQFCVSGAHSTGWVGAGAGAAEVGKAWGAQALGMESRQEGPVGTTRGPRLPPVLPPPMATATGNSRTWSLRGTQQGGHGPVGSRQQRASSQPLASWAGDMGIQGQWVCRARPGCLIGRAPPCVAAKMPTCLIGPPWGETHQAAPVSHSVSRWGRGAPRGPAAKGQFPEAGGTGQTLGLLCPCPGEGHPIRDRVAEICVWRVRDRGLPFWRPRHHVGSRRQRLRCWGLSSYVSSPSGLRFRTGEKSVSAKCPLGPAKDCARKLTRSALTPAGTATEPREMEQVAWGHRAGTWTPGTGSTEALSPPCLLSLTDASARG